MSDHAIMSTLPPCPTCSSTLTYEDGELYICPECGHEWQAGVVSEKEPDTAVRDAYGNVLQDGDAVLVRSPHGEMKAHIRIAAIRPGNVQAFFPEANPLLSPTRRDESGVFDDNAVVEVVPIR